MTAQVNETLLDKITSYYLASEDFNGCSLSWLRGQGSGIDMKIALRDLHATGQIDVLSPEFDPNPAIKRLPAPPRDLQLQAIEQAESDHHLFVYPHPTVLSAKVNPHDYSGRPFTLLLASGAAQLEYRPFDLSVLEFYRNDPRYRYQCDGIHGFICIEDEHNQDQSFPEADKILLSSFGFAYDENFNRAVAAFLTDLSSLTPEHQQVWNAKQLVGAYRVNRHFFQTQILGRFPDEIPIFVAFVMEMKVINDMCAAMGRAPLFRKVPTDTDLPSKFGFLVRPTLQEFHDFVHLLDKLLSDNINKDFFGKDVVTEREVPRKDGKIAVEQKGTLQLLEEWCKLKIRAADMKPLEDAFKALRKVRKLRQQPAHSLENNRFDQQFFKDQRQLVIEAYTAIRTLRLMFANHPAARNVEVMDLLYRGAICSY